LAAVEALGRVWDDGVVDPLALALLGDPDQSVRAEAAHALGETWNDAAVEPLVEALLDDPQWQVRERAAQALGETGSADAVTPLTKALRDADASVRESATRALADIGPDPR
jgi:HEAT repeat protein